MIAPEAKLQLDHTASQVIVPQSIKSVLLLLIKKNCLLKAELQELSGFSERAVRYALEFLKDAGLIMESIDFFDVRRKKFKLCSGRLVEFCSSSAELEVQPLSRALAFSDNRKKARPKNWRSEAEEISKRVRLLYRAFKENNIKIKEVE